MSAIRYVRGTLPGLPGEHDIAVLEGDTHISKWVEESRRLDHDQSALPRIGKLIRRGDLVVDVGAFIGDHTAYYASLGACVNAFEANRLAWECLVKNTEPYGNDVFSVRCAIGDKEDGQVIQFIDAPYANMGAFHCVNVGPLLRQTDDPAPMRTLDRMLYVCHKVSLIKFDIEGWEVRAIRGAAKTIERHHPIIVCEVNRGALERAGTSPEELHALLTGYGYQMRDLFTEEIWLPGDARPQFDVVGRARRLGVCEP